MLNLRRAPSTIPSGSCALRSLAGVAALLALLALGACEGGETEAAGREDEPSRASSALRRDDRPEAVRARRLLDEGRADAAAPLVELVADDLGVEGPLLRARLAALRGDRASWLEEVEAARAMDPSDPRPYATAAEIYASIGRIESANAEVARGLSSVGATTPELQRARGVLAIVQPGGGRIGLELLEAAYREDPELPFLGRPLGQAYLLASKRARAEHKIELALERIESSLQFDPEDPDARQAYAELLIVQRRDFDKGLGLLEALLLEGEPVQDTLGKLTWSAGVQAQLAGDEDQAFERYLRARELDHPDVERGMAAALLGRRADVHVAAALEATVDGHESVVGEQLDEAVAIAGGGESTRYEYAERFLLAAQEALAADDLERAKRLLRGAEIADPSVRGLADARGAVYFRRSIRAMEERDPTLALAFAEEAAKAAPGDALVQQLLGELYLAQQRYASAASALDRALRNAELDGEPLGLDVTLMLARCQHLAGHSQDAIATLEHSLDSVTPYDAAQRDEAERFLRVLRDG